MNLINYLRNNNFFIFIALLNVILLLGVILLMQYTKNVLNSDVRSNLFEIVKQNREIIANRINLEIKNLLLSSRHIATKLTNSSPDAYEMNKALIATLGQQDPNIFVASREGLSYTGASPTPLNISSRHYFHLALEGIPNISERLINTFSQENELFIISVPIHHKGKIVGTLQKLYPPNELYKLCIPPLFSSAGITYIINNSGNIILSSDDNKIDDEDFLDKLSRNGNNSAVKQLRKDIILGRSNVIIVNKNDATYFAAYAPIRDVHNWYVLTSVDAEVIAYHANRIFVIFYTILIVCVLIFITIITYIMILKKNEREELQKLAFNDPITQGFTFNKLLSILPITLKNFQHKSWYLLAFDINNFRFINSTYGFEYGNTILKEVYDAINTRLLPNELLVHVWGDYFALLLCRKEPLAKPSILDPVKCSNDIVITFSGGLYPIKNIEENGRNMYDKASFAANTLKKDSPNNINLYDENFNKKILNAEYLKQKIQEALKNREFLPFYQPKININTGKLVGAEALARWKTLDGNMIAPKDFIPICESTGLIVELDMLIYEQVLIFLNNQLKSSNYNIPISVNFSRTHIDDPNFIDKIMQKLNKYEIPPNLIDVEITESLFYEKQDAMIKLADRLKNFGIKISMDDFGTGYSSFSMLKDVHIDTLKIDQSFLRGSQSKNSFNNSLTESLKLNKRDIIFKSIVQMAKMLNIDIVVEGVETIENINLMKESGCSIAQGYYYSRPLPPTQFENTYLKSDL